MKNDLKKEILSLFREEYEKLIYGKTLSEGMRFHLENKINLYNNIYRPNTDKFFNLFNEAREMHRKGKIKFSKEETELLESDIGTFGVYNNKKVPLDMPMAINDELYEAEYNGKDVDLNKPKRGGSKKFYVYVKCGDKVKKVSFGSPDMSLKLSDDEARKSFVARHDCKNKNDKCTAGYWSCRIGRYPNITGSNKKYRWW